MVYVVDVLQTLGISFLLMGSDGLGSSWLLKTVDRQRAAGLTTEAAATKYIDRHSCQLPSTSGPSSSPESRKQNCQRIPTFCEGPEPNLKLFPVLTLWNPAGPA